MSKLFFASSTFAVGTSFSPSSVEVISRDTPKPCASGVGSRGSLYLDAGGGGAALQAGVATWGGRAEVHRSAPVPKSGFVQQLEEEAEGWEEEEAAAASGASAQVRLHPLNSQGWRR